METPSQDEIRLNTMLTSREQAKACSEEKNDIQLLNDDDAVRALVLDAVLGFESSKCCYNHKRFPTQAKEHIRALLKARVYKKNKDEIDNTILKIFQMFYRGKSTRISMIVKNYLQLFDINSGFTVQPCYDYKMDENVGVKLVATRNLKVGEILNLHNFSTEFSTLPETIKMYSVTETKGNVQKVWVGPCSIANHSCESNAEYYTAEKSKVLIQVKKIINAGEEITVNYNIAYFDDACECLICKKSETSDNSTESSKRTRLQVDYNANASCLTPQEKKIAHAIYSKMFAGVEYPELLKAEAVADEKSFMDDFVVVGVDDVKNVNQLVRASMKNLSEQVQDATIFAPELENFEANALKSITECQNSLANSIDYLTADGFNKNLPEFLKTIESSITLLQNAAETMREHAVGAVQKAQKIQGFVQAKQENRAAKMAEMEILDGDSDLLPEIAKLRRPRRRSKVSSKTPSSGNSSNPDSPYTLINFDSPPSLVASIDGYDSLDETGMSCPKLFKMIYNDLLDSPKRGHTTSAKPARSRKRHSLFSESGPARKRANQLIEATNEFMITFEKTSGEMAFDPTEVSVLHSPIGYKATSNDDFLPQTSNAKKQSDQFHANILISNSIAQEFSRKWHELNDLKLA